MDVLDSPLAGRSLGIRAKIILPLAALALVLVVTVLLVIGSLRRQHERSHLVCQSLTVANSIRQWARNVGHAESLQRFVETLTDECDARLIVITTGEPAMIAAASRPEWVGRAVTDVVATDPDATCLFQASPIQRSVWTEGDGSGSVATVAMPLRIRRSLERPFSYIPGAVLVRMDDCPLAAEQDGFTAWVMPSFLAVVALTALAAEMVVSRVVLWPVQRIAAVTRAMVKGDRVARVRSTTSDELGQLGDQFDRMLDEVARREECERAATLRAQRSNEESVALLAELRAHKAALDEHAIVAITDSAGRIVYANDRFCEISKYTREELIGRDHRIINSSYHPREFWQCMWRTIMHGEVWRGEVCNRAKDGALYWVDTTIVPFRDARGRVAQHMAIRTDVTHLKTVEEQLRSAAETDALTGLPNRRVLMDRLQQSLDCVGTGENGNYALMFLDFDRFKIINDSLGHGVGDKLLMGIADRMRQHAHDTQAIGTGSVTQVNARFGGDEFVVLLEGIAELDDVQRIADRLLAELSKPYQLDRHEVVSSASIGIVVGDATYQRADEVIRDADTAMYESKRHGRGRYTVFDASMREQVQRRHYLENELRRAIEAGQLSLAYQPVVSLSDGTIVAVEALLRWQHPTEGVIEPEEFIPIAEESDLILALGQWTVERACQQLARWQKSLGTLAPRKVSINVSRKQLIRLPWTELLTQASDRCGLVPAVLQIELTEDVLGADTALVLDAIRTLDAAGVELVVDDFGIGTSSFASLHRFPISAVKIHRSMLVDVATSQDVASLIHGLAVMVRNMGISLTAEGVETAAQAIALQDLGCDSAQGFLFAKPLTPAEVVEFVSRNLGLSCHAEGAMAYLNQWHERLIAYEDVTRLGIR
jgi:diguanylate cyclase (GGDEF)-like protein/PAS domain S-box-containing protein